MKDEFSFEDSIKNKMEEFNDVPSPRVWQQLEQNNPSNYSNNKKSFIMKGMPIILISIMTIFLGYYGYNFIHGNDVAKGKSFDVFFDASERAEKENRILFLNVIGKKEARKDCPELDCPELEKTKEEKDLDAEIEKIIVKHFIQIDVDIRNENYSSFFEKYSIGDGGESLFFKDGVLKMRSQKMDDVLYYKRNLKNNLNFLVTGRYQGTLSYLNEDVLDSNPINPKIQAFSDANRKAKEAGKIVLAKITMEGCTFCGKMEKETVLSDEVQNALKGDFITLDMDIFDTDYKAFFEHYNIKATPTYLFLSPNGDVLSKVAGFRPKDVFLEAVELALEEDIKLKNKVINARHEDDGHGHRAFDHEHVEKQSISDVLLKEMFEAHKKVVEEMFLKNEEATVNKGVGDYDEIIEQMKIHQEKAFEQNFGHSPLKLKAYPNPNNGSFKLDIEGAKKEGFLYFTNQKGDILLKEKVDLAPYARTLEYDFPIDGNQTIFLRLEQDENVTVKKVIIQK